MKKKVFVDPIVEEVRDTKTRLAQKFNYDVRAMLGDVCKRQKPPRLLRKTRNVPSV